MVAATLIGAPPFHSHFHLDVARLKNLVTTIFYFSGNMSDARIFKDEAALGEAAAEWSMARLLAGQRRKGVMSLGCPSGRSPRSTYRALGRLVAQHGADLSRLHLVMMDEFVERDGDGWTWCSSDAHYSCARFGELEIRQVLNAGLEPAHRIPAQNLHMPDPDDPLAYEALIDGLGGIDVFILASGATDGHVAFNPPGSAADEPCRVVRLAEDTRRDNLSTFPGFKRLTEVPQWGVTVGPGTIARASSSALMILSGESKRHAYRRIQAALRYEADWPATVIRAIRDGEVFADIAATGPEASATP